MFGGNPEGGFNELLQEAAKIKGAQMATMRTEFDSWPVFFKILYSMEKVSKSSKKGESCLARKELVP